MDEILINNTKSAYVENLFNSQIDNLSIISNKNNEERSIFTNEKTKESENANTDETKTSYESKNKDITFKDFLENFSTPPKKNLSFSKKDIDLLSEIKLNKYEWGKVMERNMTNLEGVHAEDISKFAKLHLNDEGWNDLLNLINKIGLRVVSDNLPMFLRLTATEAKKFIKLNKISDAPLFYKYEKIKLSSSTISPIHQQDYFYTSALTVWNFSKTKYEKLNEKLYGKKTPNVQNIFDEFHQKYPNINLMVDNDVTFETAKKIIKSTEEFIDYQRKANAEYAKTIQFSKMTEAAFYAKGPNSTPSKIYVNIYCDSTEKFLALLTHENGHYKTYLDRRPDSYKGSIPENIQNLLNKILSEISTLDTKEAVAELIRAIETPGDKDETNMTDKIRLRRDKDGNLILMVAKDSDVTKQEVEILGKFFRQIDCPEIIPDYKKRKHGSINDYNETIIRKPHPKFIIIEL